MTDDKSEGTAEETQEDSTATEDQGPDSIVDDVDDVEVALAEPDVAEETETTEETKDDDSTDEVEQISDEQYAEAEKLGISRSQADGIGVDGLPRVMRRLTPLDSAQTSDAPAARDAVQSAIGVGPTEIAPGKQTELDPDFIDEKIIQRFEGMEAASAQQISQLQGRLHKLTVEAELREERESKTRFDGMIASLDGYDKEFGSSTPTRVQQANRSEIRSLMDIERAGRESLGYPSRSDSQLLQRALTGEYSNKAKQQAREEISSTLTKRAKQHISRPTQSKGPKLTGKQRAIRKITAKWNELGLDELDSVGEDDLAALDT